MSEEQDKTEKLKAESDSRDPVGGERLAEARRAQQISVLEIAKELHLDEPKVRALECNDFDMLGAPVFAKGHLRKYAELVGVDADDLFSDYYQLTRSASLPPVVAASRSKARKELTPGPWIAAIIVILAAAIGYWWLISGDVVVVPPLDAVPQEQQPEPSSATSSDTDSLVTTAGVPDDEPAPLPEPVREAEPAVQDPPDGQLRLSLTFTGDCWTEITDADGRRLFFDMGRSGRTVELTGRPPLRALFGNADNVGIRVNGNNFSIPASARDNRTARLAILNP